MRVIIYESSSFGGCFDYAQQLFPAFLTRKELTKLSVLVPENSNWRAEGVHAVLCNDRPVGAGKWLRKWLFVKRNFLNPLRLWRFLRGAEPSWVLLNDFEQLTALWWAPLFRLSLRKHRFAVLLHDPDRDAYPPARWFSALSMRAMMRLMRVAFYHETLPKRWYYASEHCQYVSVPHGIYPPHTPDAALLADIAQFARGRYLLALVGNIRHEKNPELLLEALLHVPNVALLVAGNPSSSAFDADAFRAMIAEKNLTDRVWWIQRFLSDSELAACVAACNALALYYKPSFSSQSALLNLAAPYACDLLVSRTPSALSAMVKRFNLAPLIEADKLDALCDTLSNLSKNSYSDTAAWEAYRQFASWDANAEQVFAAFGSYWN